MTDQRSAARGRAQLAEGARREQAHRPGGPAPEQLMEAEVTEFVAVPVFERDKPAALLDMVGKALEDFPAADAGLSLAKEFRNRPPGRLGRLRCSPATFAACQQRM